MKRSFKLLMAIMAAMILLCGPMIKSRGVEFLPVLEEGKSWVLASIYWKSNSTTGNIYYDTVYSKMKVIGDTTVYDLPCKKLSVTGMNGENPRQIIRWDDNGQLYEISQNCIIPLMDMNHEKGDSIERYDQYGELSGSYMKVKDSGTTITIDGLERKYITFGGWPSFVWVEGIGYSTDLTIMSIFPYFLDYLGTFMESCMKDGEVIFTKDDFDRLGGEHTGIDKIRHTEDLTVTYSDGTVSAICGGKEVSLELYSLEGSLIGRSRSDDKAVLETSYLPSGIYIVKATSGETSAVRKIVM